MNARERADKILNYINGEFGVNPSVTGDQSNLEFISAAIEEAENFAWLKGFKAGDSNGESKGFSAAREQAAKIWEEDYLAAGPRIRTMKPDGEGV